MIDGTYGVFAEGVFTEVMIMYYLTVTCWSVYIIKVMFSVSLQ